MSAAVDAEQNTCANWQEAFAALPEPEDYTVSNQIRSKDGHFSITRMKGRIMFRTERSKRTGGTYFLDEELIRMIGNEFRSSGAYMQAQRWDYSETEHPQLKNILKYLYEKGTVFYRVANERREYSRRRGVKAENQSEATGQNKQVDPDIELAQLIRPASNQKEALEALKELSGKEIVNRETKIPAQINRKQRDKLVSGAALQKSKNNGFDFSDHFHAIANIDRLYENANLVTDHPDKNGDPNVISIKRFVAPVVLESGYAEAYITVKETVGNKIYSLELDELKKPSDLKGGTLKERYHIPEGYYKLLHKIEKIKSVSEKNPKKDEKQHSLRRRQVNPIIEDKALQEEYAEELSKNEYTPETLEQWDREAVKWILRNGGILGAVEKIIGQTEHHDRHIASLARRHVMQSDVFQKLDAKTRAAVETEHIFAGTAWGLEGVARRLASLTLDSVERVQALFNKLNSKLPDAERRALREKILKEFGIDILELPDDITENRKRLDALLRAYSAKAAKLGDKIYEYWINAILSGPQTHAANIIGNTANALYELGPKRLAEAAINLLARKKDGATFGEFRQMWKAIDIRSAWKAAMEAYDLEMLSPSGKLIESANAAIGGKTGRAVRIPGRLLNAADAFAKYILIPVEAASRAYRDGTARGLSGKALESHIEQQMKDPRSKAYRAGEASASAIIFRENPGEMVNYLVGLKNKNWILKFMLPFVRTPYNILRQGIRKSPLGLANLAYETGEVLTGARKLDSEYLGHAAEQLLAWGAFLAMGGFDDDDEPWITGSSDIYGSSKEKFRRNALPAYSVRIGDTWYSYKRIEPLATALALMADAKEAIRRARNGKEVSAALGEMVRKSSKMISEKSYLDSLNQLYKLVEDPGEAGPRWAAGYAASWMPNLARQTLAAFDPTARDMKLRDEGAGEFFELVTSRMGITHRVPKVDVFGREVGKNKAEQAADAWDGLYRLLVPIEKKDASSGHNGTDIITKWNWTHPEEEWHPSEPAWKGSIGGKKYQMDSETYHDYCVDAGKLADRQINNAVRHRLINPGKPTEAQMELMKKIFSRARKETKERYIRQRRIQLTR